MIPPPKKNQAYTQESHISFQCTNLQVYIYMNVLLYSLLYYFRDKMHTNRVYRPTLQHVDHYLVDTKWLMRMLLKVGFQNILFQTFFQMLNMSTRSFNLLFYLKFFFQIWTLAQEDKMYYKFYLYLPSFKVLLEPSAVSNTYM